MHISIHSPHARGDISFCNFIFDIYYFNPLPSCEGRLFPSGTRQPSVPFQSTPLMRGETGCQGMHGRMVYYFNPLPSCEGRRCTFFFCAKMRAISIHSPHAREDETIRQQNAMLADFNPLPSCEGRQLKLKPDNITNNFNPLPSCEGRRLFMTFWLIMMNFNPLPSCEGRRHFWRRYWNDTTISIHSPHARGDPWRPSYCTTNKDFNPLPSCEGRR